MKRFTIGITTHNEASSISALLNDLAKLRPDEVNVILYDDRSDDETASIVRSHPIAKRSNFLGYFSDTNNGTPSVGRTYIGQNAQTEYTTLIDGDDHVDIEELRKLLEEAPSGYDMILTTYLLRQKKVGLGTRRKAIELDNNSVMHLLSGIGGRVYRSELLAEYGPDDTKGRSDDVRLNMRILSAGPRKLFTMPDVQFYRIPESRKSARVKTLNFDEFAARIKRYELLQSQYGLDKRYLAALKRNLRKTVRQDDSVLASTKRELIAKIDDTIRLELKRVVFIGDDMNAIGGVPGRLRQTIQSSQGRDVEYVLLCRKSVPSLPNTIEVTNEEATIGKLKQWSAADTIVLTANNILRRYPASVRRKLSEFPLVYMCSAQMAFMIQDSPVLADAEYVEQFRCSKIIAFSEADISFQRQLGIHGQVQGFLPVKVRQSNDFDPSRNVHLGYVGRIDYHTKGCERLIDVVRALKEAGLPPLKIFTTGGKNSPDYPQFFQTLESAGLSDHVDVTLECSDKDVIYREISMLLLPSKKESWGNVVLEAFSYGIPVISTVYAPGPAELIDHGTTGYLVEDFSGEAIVELVNGTAAEQLEQMSNAAFGKHRSYSMTAHLEFLEKMGTDVINSFAGKNELPVLPKLTLTNKPPKKGSEIVRDTPKTSTASSPKSEDGARHFILNRKEYAADRLAPLEAEIARLEEERSLARERHRLAGNG